MKKSLYSIFLLLLAVPTTSHIACNNFYEDSDQDKLKVLATVYKPNSSTKEDLFILHRNSPGSPMEPIYRSTSDINFYSRENLHTSIIEDSMYLVTLILDKKPELINEQDELGQTAIHIAILNNHVKIVTELLARNADLSIQGSLGYTPLELVVMLENVELLTIIDDSCIWLATVSSELISTMIALATGLKNEKVIKSLKSMEETESFFKSL